MNEILNLREKYPVSDFYEVLDGFDIYRGDDLIIAIVAVKKSVTKGFIMFSVFSKKRVPLGN